jgi:glutathione S-transferase
MRVRMVLVEKKLPWTSHVIDLSKMEHATPEYQSINPNGLVPTLVHEGHTYIASIDIIQYLMNSHRSRHLPLSIPKIRQNAGVYWLPPMAP